MHACDGKFTDEDLNEEGNASTQAYFDPEDGEYLDDYESLLLNELSSLYHVEDTWQNFDLIKPILDKLDEWRRGTLTPGDGSVT